MIDEARLQQVALLHEDDDIAVLVKPPGLAVHGGAGEKKKTLLDVLGAADPATSWTLVHRLDKATSGVMVVAKSAAVASSLAAQWDSTQKNYVALAFGHMSATTITRPIVDKHGNKQSAVTQVTSAQPLASTTLLHITLHTGRKHQIRRHLADAGYPIAMDDKYGDFRRNKAFVRALREHGAPRPKHLFLAAVRLVLADGRAFDAPLFDVWRAVLEAEGSAVDELAFLT